MRRHLICAAAVLAAAPALALDLPARKPGLWEIKTMMEGGMQPTQTAQHCIDGETDKLMNSLGTDMGKQICSKQDVKKVGNTYEIDSVCKFGPMTSTSHGVVSGDFNSAYTMKMTSKSDGGSGMPGKSGEGTTNITVEAKWLGACAADQKPGDMIMAGGRKVNVRDIQSMQNKMQDMMKHLPKGMFQKN
jgi:carbon monoxide dehydrogenase subunit G